LYNECLPIAYVQIIMPEKSCISLNYYEGHGPAAGAEVAAGVAAAAAAEIGVLVGVADVGKVNARSVKIE
jgi:hypothetical protein